MTAIQLTTIINAPIAKVFDLNRDIGIHLLSTSQSKEEVIAGRTLGLIEKNETVTWRAKHFGVYLTHKSHIPEMEIPFRFVDVMIEGQFASFRHTHSFEQKEGITVMTDQIVYETPFGIFGKLFDILILKRYLTGFIRKRNIAIKEIAENQDL